MIKITTGVKWDDAVSGGIVDLASEQVVLDRADTISDSKGGTCRTYFEQYNDEMFPPQYVRPFILAAQNPRSLRMSGEAKEYALYLDTLPSLPALQEEALTLWGEDDSWRREYENQVQSGNYHGDEFGFLRFLLDCQYCSNGPDLYASAWAILATDETRKDHLPAELKTPLKKKIVFLLRLFYLWDSAESRPSPGALMELAGDSDSDQG